MVRAVSELFIRVAFADFAAVRRPKEYKAGETGGRLFLITNNHFSIACGETARIAFLPSWDHWQVAFSC